MYIFADLDMSALGSVTGIDPTPVAMHVINPQALEGMAVQYLKRKFTVSLRPQRQCPTLPWSRPWCPLKMFP